MKQTQVPMKLIRPVNQAKEMPIQSRWHRPQSNNGVSSDVWIMGVLNCTPDSFSDGGSFFNIESAIQHGLQMFKQGAAIIDVGGESTRPGSEKVSLQEELARTIPVIKALAEHGCLVSADTMKAEVMRQAIDAGACMINDVSALTHDAESLSIVADSGIDVCLMHMQGSPKTMQQQPQYKDAVEDVSAFFSQRIDACLHAGIKASAITLDPGIGFGKRLQDNLALIQGIRHFKKTFDMPILLGVSRKSFLGQLTDSPVSNREVETAVAGAMGIGNGADMLRVHDVPLQRRAVQVASALSPQTSF